MPSTEQLVQKALALATSAFDELDAFAEDLSADEVQDAWLQLRHRPSDSVRETWSRFAAMALLGGVRMARNSDSSNERRPGG
jgi:hypothetical protein